MIQCELLIYRWRSLNLLKGSRITILKKVTSRMARYTVYECIRYNCFAIQAILFGMRNFSRDATLMNQDYGMTNKMSMQLEPPKKQKCAMEPPFFSVKKRETTMKEVTKFGNWGDLWDRFPFSTIWWMLCLASWRRETVWKEGISSCLAAKSGENLPFHENCLVNKDSRIYINSN